MDKLTRRSLKRRVVIIISTSLIFLLMHMCGVQEHVSVLAGVHSGSGGEMLFGCAYILLYLLMISVIPILLISIPFLLIL